MPLVQLEKHYRWNLEVIESDDARTKLILFIVIREIQSKLSSNSKKQKPNHASADGTMYSDKTQ